MGTRTSYSHTLFVLLPLLLAMVPESTQLHSSQTWSLLKIQQLLNYPAVLSTWRNDTDFCYGGDYKTGNSFVECYGDSMTQLHVIGPAAGAAPLPKTFSVDAFFTTLSRLPDLRVLTLTGLGLWGPLPGKVSRLVALEIVNVSRNFLYGELPEGVSRLGNLQTLIADDNMLAGVAREAAVAGRAQPPEQLAAGGAAGVRQRHGVAPVAANNLSGDVPDLSALENLQAVDLAYDLISLPLASSALSSLLPTT
jgi:hypothetical protein